MISGGFWGVRHALMFLSYPQPRVIERNTVMKMYLFLKDKDFWSHFDLRICCFHIYMEPNSSSRTQIDLPLRSCDILRQARHLSSFTSLWLMLAFNYLPSLSPFNLRRFRGCEERAAQAGWSGCLSGVKWKTGKRGGMCVRVRCEWWKWSEERFLYMWFGGSSCLTSYLE